MNKFEKFGTPLTRSEMREIRAGKATPVCGSCQYQNPGGEGPVTCLSGAEAQSDSQRYGGYWCCSSCCSASWADHTGCA